jgi:ABC-type Fe3+/spermidine/putrescine transport system ATPase subunit
VLEIGLVRVQRAGFTVSVAGQALQAGQQLTIIGPSGGGKSSLLRALVGLEPRAQVQGLRWQGQDISSAPPHRRPFAWLPQDLGLWPNLSALAHVAFARTRGASVRPSDADTQLLARLGLAQRGAALPGQLSGGEQQRLSFARVLAMRPAWAVLDEPFSHLDPVMALELAQLFQELAGREGVGLVQVSHQLQSPGDKSHFWVLEDGTLTQSGHWPEISTRPATPWIARFVALQR